MEWSKGSGELSFAGDYSLEFELRVVRSGSRRDNCSWGVIEGTNMSISYTADKETRGYRV